MEPMTFLEIYKVLKLNLEDKAIGFERSNQITQNWRSAWLNRRRLENQLELANEIAQVGQEFLNWSRKIWQSTRISQWGHLRGGEILKKFSIRSRGMIQSTWIFQLGCSRVGDSWPNLANQNVKIQKSLVIWRLVNMKCVECFQGIVYAYCLELSCSSREVTWKWVSLWVQCAQRASVSFSVGLEVLNLSIFLHETRRRNIVVVQQISAW